MNSNSNIAMTRGLRVSRSGNHITSKATYWDDHRKWNELGEDNARYNKVICARGVRSGPVG
eukprot:2827149-Karenia_brevis.AAC.1